MQPRDCSGEESWNMASVVICNLFLSSMHIILHQTTNAKWIVRAGSKEMVCVWVCVAELRQRERQKRLFADNPGLIFSIWHGLWHMAFKILKISTALFFFSINTILL